MGLRQLTVLVVAASLALGACGAGASGTGSSTSAPKSFTVVGTEMAFTAPDRVPAGHYLVEFRNDGTVYHELALKDPSGAFVARRSIAAGQQVVLDVVLKPGTWELGCFEPGHYEGGMHRTMVVEAT